MLINACKGVEVNATLLQKKYGQIVLLLEELLNSPSYTTTQTMQGMNGGGSVKAISLATLKKKLTVSELLFRYQQTNRRRWKLKKTGKIYGKKQKMM
jgi:hypothetical protein